MLSIFSQLIFGNSSLFGAKDVASGSSSWRDKTLCFDLRSTDLDLGIGEQLIACFFPIEDVKGNQDEAGLLKVTNLRLIWISCNKKRVNLSIGWRTVSLTFEQNLKDSLGQSVTSLCILTKFESTKYEFVFSKMQQHVNFSQQDYSLVELWKYIHDKSLQITHLTPMLLADPFDVVFKVWQCYKQTNLFRHSRANLTNLIVSADKEAQKKSIKFGNINRLPGEEIIDIYPDVTQSESRGVKFLGSLILTNVRLIWIDESLTLRNLSIPYLRIDSLKFKESYKIIVHTHDYLATSNQIKFLLPKSKDSEARKSKQIFEQIQNLYSLYKAKPKFGPEVCEDCINFMSHLKPIRGFLEMGDFLDQRIEKVGSDKIYLVNVDQTRINEDVDLENLKGARSTSERDPADENENELSRYTLKLNSYLNEQPIQRDRELIYSPDLGLAVERPANDIDLKRIWRIDI